MSVPLTDLKAHRERIGGRIDAAILEVVDSGRWIMGPAIARVEDDLSKFCGARHTVSCSNGTDALLMGLLAMDVQPGDAVICPTFTFAATAEAIAFVGAVPVFVDCEEGGFNICPTSVEEAFARGSDAGLRVVGILAVDLFGIAADYPALDQVASAHGAWVMADAAQSFGCSTDGRRVGTLAPITTTSFFPAKPLGCYGDGGAVFTDDDDLASVLRSLRVHGKGTHKYDNVRVGLNARLDPIQAVVLSEKLTIFESELEARRRAASYYDEALRDVVEPPRVSEGIQPAWAQYTVRVPNRDTVRQALQHSGIDTAVYYPMPLHRQTAYRSGAGARLVDCRRASAAAREVLSLPMHPYITDSELDEVAGRLLAVCGDHVRAGAELGD